VLDHGGRGAPVPVPCGTELLPVPHGGVGVPAGFDVVSVAAVVTGGAGTPGSDVGPGMTMVQTELEMSVYVMVWHLSQPLGADPAG